MLIAGLSTLVCMGLFIWACLIMGKRSDARICREAHDHDKELMPIDWIPLDGNGGAMGEWRGPLMNKPGTPREQIEQFLTLHNACNEGVEFARQFSCMAEVWERCPRVQWLIWMFYKTNCMPLDSELRKFAAWCVRETPITGNRKVWDLLTDERPLAAVVAAERYANGEITDSELAAAGAAAWAAARAAAGAAARAAAGAAERAAAWDAAGDAAGAYQADEFKRRFPNPFLRGCMIGKLGGLIPEPAKRRRKAVRS